jgi:bacterial/archaeal transporter family protein
MPRCIALYGLSAPAGAPLAGRESSTVAACGSMGREGSVAMASWQMWALMSAGFAALTAIFAKLGVENISPDAATLIRTVVIVVVLGALVTVTRQLPDLARASARTYAWLTLSGLATGASWWCYFRALRLGDAARVAPLDKLSVVLVALFATAFLGERLAPLNWLGVALISAGAWFVTLRP